MCQLFLGKIIPLCWAPVRLNVSFGNHMKNLISLVIICTLFMSSSLSARPATKKLSLSNGETIEMEQFSKVYAGADDTWVLIFNYVTDSIDDISILKKRAEVIWKDFRPVVVKHGFKAAGITAKQYVKDEEGLLTSVSESQNYTFVYIKTKTGNWIIKHNKK